MTLRFLFFVAWILALAGIPPLAADPAGASPDSLEALPRPDLSRLAPEVRAVLRRSREELERALADTATEPFRLAPRFGSTGLFYHAHLLLEPAAACYRNAARLDSGDYRWPYYLGYAREQAGDLEGAAGAYARALVLEPSLDTAALRLGGVDLELGRLRSAQPLLERAVRIPALAAAAGFELGRLAYARGEHAAAVKALEGVLATDPGADRVHYTLGLAYRALGDLARARAHLARRGEGEPGFPDPLVERLESLSTGQRMVFHSGMDASHRDDYPAAVRLFREGLAGEPDNRNARVSLARFLYLNGDAEGARQQLEQALADGRGPLLGRFLLALLLDEAGRSRVAREVLEAVLQQDPAHAGAHFYLAGIAWRSGEYALAAGHYGEALAAAPDNVQAAQWQVLASILAGAPEPRLKTMLEAMLARDPRDPTARFFLAALLAAATDPAVRDGGSALVLARGLYQDHPSPGHAELLAMARAGAGDFDGAQALQQGILELAVGQLRLDLAGRLQAELEEYRAGRPWRTPWDRDALRALSPPTNVPKVFRAYPSETPF